MAHAQRAFVLLAADMALILLVACGAESLHPELAQGPIVTVEGWRTDNSHDTVRSSDTAAIETLLKVLNTGEPSKDHRCGNRRTIVFHLADSSTTTLGILSGHTQGYYEYRLYDGNRYDVFRVKREPLLKALSVLGFKIDVDE